MVKTKKAAVEVSFGWLFAIVIGAAILFIAITASTKIINLGTTESDTKIAKEILILFNPLESSFESGKTTSFQTDLKTRIYTSCDNEGNFGKQKLRVSQFTLNKWSDNGMNVSFENKYIFSEEPVEGKRFYIFSKPFEMPFKVADLIYLTSDSKPYCFENIPESWELKNDLSLLNQSNPQLILDNCPPDSIKVCINSGCDITINGDEISGSVLKDGQTVYYSGSALLVAAIFSNPYVYECQVKRLMQRTESLAELYVQKEKIIKQSGCDSNLESDLISLEQTTHISTSRDLLNVQRISDKINEENKYALCRLW